MTIGNIDAGKSRDALGINASKFWEKQWFMHQIILVEPGISPTYHFSSQNWHFPVFFAIKIGHFNAYELFGFVTNTQAYQQK